MNRKEYKVIVNASWVIGTTVLLCLPRSLSDTMLSLSLLSGYTLLIAVIL